MTTKTPALDLRSAYTSLLVLVVVIHTYRGLVGLLEVHPGVGWWYGVDTVWSRLGHDAGDGLLVLHTHTPAS